MKKLREIAQELGFYIALFLLGMLFQQYYVTPKVMEIRVEKLEKTVNKLCDDMKGIRR